MVAKGAVVWLLVKLFVLYTTSLLLSISVFVYLNQTILPPHQTLKYPLTWRQSEGNTIGVVELERGQRFGGNFSLRSEKKNHEPAHATEEQNVKYSVIQGSVPYDISLLLKYPDRPEIADLGNLKIVTNLVRRDGESAVKIESVQALRYETRVLRLVRDVLSVPGALWRDSGSERTERISLATRLVDDLNAANPSNGGKLPGKKDFGVDHFNSNKKLGKQNPIERVEISISPLPPLHSVHLEVLANLSPLQHVLFHWRIPAAILIVGGCTALLWFLVTIYALIEVVRIFLSLLKEHGQRSRNVVKSASVVNVTEESVEIVEESGSSLSISSSTLESATSSSDEDSAEIVSVPFPPAESVATFIGDLRQRKLQAIINDNDDDDDVSKYNSDVEDQSVPERSEAQEEQEEEKEE